MGQCSMDLSGLSVLVIDDSDHMRSILKCILSAFRIRRIFEARDGADGLYMTAAWRPDVILCDWLMRPLNGGEFITILRSDQDPAVAATPAILVSAYTSKAVILKAVRLGFHEVLVKPVSPVALYQRLERLVRDDRPFLRTRSGLRLAPRREAGPVERPVTSPEEQGDAVAFI